MFLQFYDLIAAGSQASDNNVFVFRKLGVVVDVSCDPNNPNNPLPFYDSATTFDQPCERVKLK